MDNSYSKLPSSDAKVLSSPDWKQVKIAFGNGCNVGYTACFKSLKNGFVK